MIHTYNLNMSKSIILSSVLFGSIFLCSISLNEINKIDMKKGKILIYPNILNYSIFIFSGSICLCSLHRMKYLK